MAASRKRSLPRILIAVGVVGLVAGLLLAFPLFRIVPLRSPGSGPPATHVAFDSASAAVRIWNTDLRAAAERALELKTFAAQLRANPAETRKTYSKEAGLGTAYYFVRGSGRVVARDRNYLHVALDGTESTVVAIRIGPVFGNAVRDGSGVLEVNSFPGLQEFNALAAELNALVEKQVLPALREKANVGTIVCFAGCAEAPETIGDSSEPILTVVPVEAGVR
jgi:predicted lipoprotein